MPKTCICKNCGMTFTRPPSQAGPYCSIACCVAHKANHRPEKFCIVCGKSFRVSPSLVKRVQTCSEECGRIIATKKITGENNYHWQGKRKLTTCEMCGMEFQSVEHPRTGWSRFCSRTCKDMAQAKLIEGILNGRWVGGKSHEPYPVGFNNSLRKAIRNRDGHKCILCGNPENGRRLDIHHIDYDKNNLSPDNLVALCRGCNSKVNHNRGQWTTFFRSAHLER